MNSERIIFGVIKIVIGTSLLLLFHKKPPFNNIQIEFYEGLSESSKKLFQLAPWIIIIAGLYMILLGLK